jgi:hypothetical protein
MPTKQERFKKLYDQTPEHISEMYSSFELGEIIDSLHKKYSIEDIPSFVHSIGDTILGFYKISELPALLQKEVEVSADDAMRIMGELEEFLAPVIAREKGEVNPNRAELQELQKTMASPPTTTVPTAQPADSTEESTPAPQEPHSPVQAMRTMEGDMSRVHGYGAYRAEFPEEQKEAEHTEKVIRSASQQDLLQEKPKLAGMPTYEEKK